MSNDVEESINIYNYATQMFVNVCHVNNVVIVTNTYYVSIKDYDGTTTYYKVDNFVDVDGDYIMEKILFILDDLKEYGCQDNKIIDFEVNKYPFKNIKSLKVGEYFDLSLFLTTRMLSTTQINK